MSGKLTRSRNGCLTCRKRKRKCDEAHPACGNCINLNFVCDWPTAKNDNVKNYKVEKIKTDPFRFVKIKQIQSKIKIISHRKPQINDHQSKTPVSDNEASIEEINSESTAIPEQTMLKQNKPQTFEGCIDVVSSDVIEFEKYPSEIGVVARALTSAPLLPTVSSVISSERVEELHGILSSPSSTPISSSTTEEAANDFYVPPSASLSSVKELIELVSVTGKDDGLEHVHNSEEDQNQNSLISDLDRNRIFNVLSSSYDLTTPSSWIPGKKLNRLESFLFYTYVNCFIPTVTPHIFVKGSLLPGTVFLPAGLDLQCVRNLFLCCGAGYLSFYRPEYYAVFKSLYEKSLTELNEVVTSTDVQGTENWVFVASQQIVLLHRYFTLDARKCSRGIALSYKFVRKRRAANMPISSDDKLLFESFLYNYCSMIWNCPDDEFESLPSPFKAFGILEEFYVVPDYWLSSPILGACFGSLNLLSKTIWLMRQKTHEIYMDLFLDLYDKALSFDPPLMPSSEKLAGFSSKHRNELKCSVNLSGTYTNATLILLRFVMTKCDATDDAIQSYVENIYNIFQTIDNKSNVLCVCHLSLIIGTICSIKLEHRDFFLKMWRHIDSKLHRFTSVYVFELIRKCWEAGVVDINTFLSRDGFDMVTM